MMGKSRFVVVAVIAVCSFIGYAYLFSMVLGVDTADAISVLTRGTVPKPDTPDRGKKDSAVVSENSGTVDLTMIQSESFDDQLRIINAAKADLEKTREEVKALLEEKDRQDNKKLNDLARIYDNMDPADLANVMVGLEDSVIVRIIPRMDSQKASLILESMPPTRAAAISALLLGEK